LTPASDGGISYSEAPTPGIKLDDIAAEHSLAPVAGVGVALLYGKKRTLFSQGDPAHAIYFIQAGAVKLSAVSAKGRVAVIATLAPGDFFGEGCLSGQGLRTATATTLSNCKLLRFEKPDFVGLLRGNPEFAERFLSHTLSRNIQLEENVLDLLFNSSEKRLARVLLLLARFTAEGETQIVIPKVSQETLAQMVGCTRSRVNIFLNKFRKLGLIEYKGRITVYRSLLNVSLRD